MSVENLSLNENSAYVGASVTFRGDLIASDTVIVEGTVEGNVTAGSVSSERTARSREASPPPTPRSKAFCPKVL
jgi:cytoskeletal protein CcmA (bactofilin family)